LCTAFSPIEIEETNVMEVIAMEFQGPKEGDEMRQPAYLGTFLIDLGGCRRSS